MNCGFISNVHLNLHFATYIVVKYIFKRNENKAIGLKSQKSQITHVIKINPFLHENQDNLFYYCFYC